MGLSKSFFMQGREFDHFLEQPTSWKVSSADVRISEITFFFISSSLPAGKCHLPMSDYLTVWCPSLYVAYLRKQDICFCDFICIHDMCYKIFCVYI